MDNLYTFLINPIIIEKMVFQYRNVYMGILNIIIWPWFVMVWEYSVTIGWTYVFIYIAAVYVWSVGSALRTEFSGRTGLVSSVTPRPDILLLAAATLHVGPCLHPSPVFGPIYHHSSCNLSKQGTQIERPTETLMLSVSNPSHTPYIPQFFRLKYYLSSPKEFLIFLKTH